MAWTREAIIALVALFTTFAPVLVILLRRRHQRHRHRRELSRIHQIDQGEFDRLRRSYGCQCETDKLSVGYLDVDVERAMPYDQPRQHPERRQQQYQQMGSGMGWCPALLPTVHILVPSVNIYLLPVHMPMSPMRAGTL